jgi:HK97 family phage major capsid protein
MSKRTPPESIKLGRQFIGARIVREAVNIADRTVELAFSSEQPVERWWGIEILSHDKGDADLGWLSSGRAPYLVDHDTGQQIGVIEKAWIGNDKTGRALARFGTSPRAEQELQDCAAGIRVNVSVGYLISELTLVEMNGDPDDDGDQDATYRAKWTPLEISNVAIPADMTVGIGRAAAGDDAREVRIIATRDKGKTTMETDAEKAARLEREQRERTEREQAERSRVELAGASAEAVKTERQRIADIMVLGQRHNMRTLAEKHVADGTSIEAFRGVMLMAIEPGKPLETAQADLGMSPKDARQFSFVRAMRAQLAPGDAARLAPFEVEASRAVADKVGRAPNGFFVPVDVQRSQMQGRSLSVGTTTAGGFTVETDLLAENFIGLLRNSMMTRAMGATVLSGLVGNVAIPKQTGAATVTWQPEAANPSESDQAVGQVTLSPKQAMGFTDYSRLLLQQSSLDVENFVRADLAAIMGLAIDLAGLHGTGSSNQPTGIAATSGIGSVVGGTNGAAPTWGNVVGLETAVAVANAAVGATGYLTNAAVRGKLKTTDKTAGGYGQFIWPDVAGPAPGFGLLNGYKVGVSNQVSSTLTKGTAAGICSALFFGNWADLMIGEWGVLDLLVNPFTNAVSGAVRIHVYQTVDIGVRRAASFAAMLDALTP